MKDILIQTLAPVAATVISTLASLALYELKKFIAARAKNENVNAAMTRITETVQTTVDHLTQTIATNLKEKSETGKLTKSQSNLLKQDAVKTVLKQLPDETVKAAELAVKSINGLIGSKIEQAILKQKAALPAQLGKITRTAEGA
jgi:hypothetical protein